MDKQRAIQLATGFMEKHTTIPIVLDEAFLRGGPKPVWVVMFKYIQKIKMDPDHVMVEVDPTSERATVFPTL